eukprot:TRINITY_DN8892_c0_g1_i1.p1 TRINITY_DN8892_c0_g1~~TRINITY_DN8892_c0_g1_i1.p1  ORF type:complete len:298 (-),score=46.31 TRINITY_DN8892_c0_g1_i1:363-1256(-)
MKSIVALALLAVQAYAAKVHTAHKDEPNSVLAMPSFGPAFAAPHRQVPAASLNKSAFSLSRTSLKSKFRVAFSAPHHESSSSLPVTALSAEGASSLFGKSLEDKLKLSNKETYAAPSQTGAFHQDAVATAVHGATSWLHRLLFGAPHHKAAPAFIQLHGTSVREPVSTSAQTGLFKTEARSSLLSKLGHVFSAPSTKGSFHEGTVSTDAHSKVSWMHRSAFAAPHSKPTPSFLASYKAGSSDSWTADILAILGRKGDYHMSTPLRAFYTIFAVILILVTIASCAWFIKETPGNKQDS